MIFDLPEIFVCNNLKSGTMEGHMSESSKFPKSWTLEIQILKLVGCLQK